MSHTNSTTNYGLPQFLPTDKPFWLTDVNQAYSDIDTAMKNNANAATTAGNDATQALSDASAASTAAANADAKGAGALASIADTYSAAATYNLDDLVIYNNLLYKNISQISTPEAWDGSHWSRVTVEDRLDLKADQATTYTKTETDTLLSQKASTASFTVKTVSLPTTTINANDIATVTLSAPGAVYKMIAGFQITDSTTVVMIQCTFNSDGDIKLRVRNVSSSASSFKAYIDYV